MHEDHDSDDGDLCLNTPQKHKKISKGRPYYKSSANNPSLTLYPQANILSYHRCVQQTACALEGNKRLEAETSSTLYLLFVDCTSNFDLILILMAKM